MGSLPIAPDIVLRFQELYTGSDLSHGHWTATEGALTDLGPPSAEDYLAHLNGERGLGLVPVRATGMCGFGALDIDVDTIDHRALWVKVKARNLPLTVCRSKSGAAHLYVFFEKPVPAVTARKLLRAWSGLLGYPRCEVFPKQDSIKQDGTQSNLGSWINLPYFGGDQSLRYAVGPEGPLNLQGFLDQAEYYDPKKKINQELPQLGEEQLATMPPCLEALTRNGLPEGGRNSGLFNFGVFYRKSEPNAWEDRVKEHNQKHTRPPLEGAELTALLRSLTRKTYQYTCEQEPISSRCDRQLCLTRQYGINHKPWEEPGSYDDIALRNLRKFDSQPPRYRLEVNGIDLELSSEDLRNFSTGFRPRVFEHLNLVLRPTKQDAWDRQLRELLKTLRVIAVPDDASWAGVVVQKTREFLAVASERSRKREDLLRGIAWQDEAGVVWFRAVDLQRFLTAAKVAYEVTKLYPLLEAQGARFEQTEVKGRRLTLWALPTQTGDRQTEPFTPPEPPAQEEAQL